MPLTVQKERVDILWNSCALGECVSDEERNVDITSIRSDPEIEIPGYSQILDSHSRGRLDNVCPPPVTYHST